MLGCEVNGLTKTEILHLLQCGSIEVEGYLPWSSNYTFLARVYDKQNELLAVYKPMRGERPLWDFAQGTLYQREMAAFLISDALGWDLVPPTVTREGPHGIGSLQMFIDHDPECHYFTFEGKRAYRRQLQQIALLDLIINNADRKGGHILLDQSEHTPRPDRLWAIDHGVCFHTSHKLRTVVWEFAGAPIPSNLLANLRQFQAYLNNGSRAFHTELHKLLAEPEIWALQKRLDRLIERGVFREPGPGRHYPWPPV